MAVQPTDPITIIAQDDVNLPSTGQPNKTLPNNAVLTTGYDSNQVVTAENLNYIFNNHGEWVQFLEDSRQVLRTDVDNLQAINLTAGDGLTGGGDLSADRTFTLGTPSSLDGSTSNSVNSNTHTHELNTATIAEAQAGTDDTKLMTPLSTLSTFKPTSVSGTTDSVELPNGLIMKWGSVSVGDSILTVNYTTPFPTAALSLQVTSSEINSTLNEQTAVAQIVDNTKFDIRYTLTGDAGGTSVRLLYWFAIGY